MDIEELTKEFEKIRRTIKIIYTPDNGQCQGHRRYGSGYLAQGKRKMGQFQRTIIFLKTVAVCHCIQPRKGLSESQKPLG